MSSSAQNRILVEDAEKLMTKGGLFARFNRVERCTEAASMFARAGSGFKLNKDFERAYSAYMRAADAQELAGEHGQASRQAYEAMTSAKLGENMTNARRALDRACALGAASKTDSVSSLGRWCLEFAEASQLSLPTPSSIPVRPAETHPAVAAAVADFERALRYVEAAPNASAQARKCREAMAQLQLLTAEPAAWSAAAKTYQDIAVECTRSQLLVFSARKYTLCAVLASLYAGDTAGAAGAVLRAQETDPSWEGSREQGFCTGMLESLRKGAIEELNTVIDTYTSIKPLEFWQRRLLTGVTESISRLREAEQLAANLELAPATAAAAAPAAAAAAPAPAELPAEENNFD